MRGTDLLTLHPDPTFRAEPDGTVRVGTSRLTLDLVVSEFENGMTPEDVVRAYDTLQLCDAYAAVAYYLRHRGEVRAYLASRADEAAALRARVVGTRPGLSREELLARRAAGTALAPTGQ